MDNNLTIDREKQKESLVMNPFSFRGRSNGFNYLVYGLITPTLIMVIGYMIALPQVLIVPIVLTFLMALASLTRRGRDMGVSPGNTIATVIVLSLIVSVIMNMTGMSMRMMFMFDNPSTNIVIAAIIQNIYLLYFVFAPKSDKEIPKMRKFEKVALWSLVSVFSLGLVSAIVMPYFA